MRRTASGSLEPSTAGAVLGSLVLTASLCLANGCIGSRQMSHGELVEIVKARDCAATGVRSQPMLIAAWRAGDITYVATGDTTRLELTPTTPVQIGGLTTAFVAAEALRLLDDRGIDLGSAATLPDLPPWPDGDRPTFADLLLHRSGLPPYAPGPPYPTDWELLGDVGRLIALDTSASLRGRYRYDLLNYALLWRALVDTSRGGRARPAGLVYSDRVDRETYRALAPTVEEIDTTRPSRRSALLSTVSGGIATLEDLLGLVVLLDSSDLADWPSHPTGGHGDRTEVVPGWHRIGVRRGGEVYLSAGATRRHAAAVAYYPPARRAVAIVATGSVRLECLAFHLLRNLSRDWMTGAVDQASDTHKIPPDAQAH